MVFSRPGQLPPERSQDQNPPCFHQTHLLNTDNSLIVTVITLILNIYIYIYSDAEANAAADADGLGPCFFLSISQTQLLRCAFFLAKPTTHARVVRHTILKRNGKKKP